MSLLPILLDDVWDDFDRPLRILDRNYGLSSRSEDPFHDYLPRSSDLLVYRPLHRRSHARRHHPYEIMRADNRMKGASVVKADKEKFHVTLDVQHFNPEEISVKVVGNNVVVEGKHEEKEDDHGWVSRQFLRKYMIPSQCDVDQVRSNLSSDGILTITAPRKPAPALEGRERIIEIQHTGIPAISEDKESPNKLQVGEKDKKEEQMLPAEKKKKSIAAA